MFIYNINEHCYLYNFLNILSIQNIFLRILKDPYYSLFFIMQFCNLKITMQMFMKLKSEEKNIESILYEILDKLQDKDNLSRQKYYRNKDMKSVYGLSPNTITKYRQEGILPYTLLGEIYLYPVAEVERRLKNNANYK